MGYDVRHISKIKVQGKETPLRMVVSRQSAARTSILEVKTVGGIRLKVEKARKSSRPLQCFRCQRLGHVAANCHCPARCVFCSESHEVKDCPAKLVQGQKPTCVLCGENHVASYGGCKALKDAGKRKVTNPKVKPKETARASGPKLIPEVRPTVSKGGPNVMKAPRKSYADACRSSDEYCDKVVPSRSADQIPKSKRGKKKSKAKPDVKSAVPKTDSITSLDNKTKKKVKPATLRATSTAVGESTSTEEGNWVMILHGLLTQILSCLPENSSNPLVVLVRGFATLISGLERQQTASKHG